MVYFMKGKEIEMEEEMRIIGMKIKKRKLKQGDLL